MAQTQAHKQPAAKDLPPTYSGRKFSSLVYFSIALRVLGLIFSLSKSIILLTNYWSFSSFLTDAQSVGLRMNVITAPITIATSLGGEVKALISEMYFLSS